jgi:hypothetical protein
MESAMTRPIKTVIFVAAMLALVALAIFLFPGFAHASTIPPITALEGVAEIPAEFRGRWYDTDRPHIMIRCSRPLDEGDFAGRLSAQTERRG